MDLSTMGLLAAAADVSSISMDQKVPIMTIICILLSLVLCIGVPIAFFILIRRRIRMVGQAVIFGVLVYMLASSVLVQFTYILIVMMPGAESLLETNRPLSAIVSVSVTALYEVLGFYLGLKLLKRTVERRGVKLDMGCALLFSLGYTAAAVIAVSSANLLQYLMVATSINSTGMQALAEGVAEGDERNNFIIAMDEFIHSPSSQYLLEGVSSVFQFIFRTCLAVLCYGAVSGKMKGTTMAVAVGAEAVFVIPQLLIYLEVFPTMWLAEICYLVIDAVLLYYVIRAVKVYMKEDWEKLMKKPEDINRPGGTAPKKMPKIVMPKD